MRAMDREDQIGLLIHSLSLGIPVGIICLSLAIAVFHGPYEYIRLGGRGIIHVISAMSLCTVFIFVYRHLQYLYPLVRCLIAGSFSALSIQLYDFTWSLCKYLRLGYDFRIPPLLAVAIGVTLLWFFHIKHDYLVLKKEPIVKTLLYTVIFVLAFCLMTTGGFYERMELYDTGLGPDPNVGNISWAVGKIVVFWILTPLIKRSSYKAPLRLDPRVLIWSDVVE